MRSLAYALFATLILSACKITRITTDKSLLYRNAIDDAMYVENKEIDTNLIAITGDSVLVVSWIPQKFKYPDSGTYTTDRETWVTVVPELSQRMKNNREKNINLRLQQLLGLPPVELPNKLFIEFWVKPADLFRPCPDKEITDKRCNLCFSKQDSVDQEHVKWITNKRLSNYNCDVMYKHYPWTALGYTYDWNPKNKNHRGLSEFVLKKNSVIYVKRITSTEAYLKTSVH